MLGTTEIVIICIVVLVLFGGKKLPELAKGLGHSKAAFDERLKGDPSSEEDEDKDDTD